MTTLVDENNDEIIEPTTEVTIPEDEKILTTEQDIIDNIELLTTVKDIIDNVETSTVIIDKGTETIDSSKEVCIEFCCDILLNKSKTF